MMEHAKLLLDSNLSFSPFIKFGHSHLNLEFLNFFWCLFVIPPNLQSHQSLLISFWYFKQRNCLSFWNQLKMVLSCSYLQAVQINCRSFFFKYSSENQLTFDISSSLNFRHSSFHLHIENSCYLYFILKDQHITMLAYYYSNLQGNYYHIYQFLNELFSNPVFDLSNLVTQHLEKSCSY